MHKKGRAENGPPFLLFYAIGLRSPAPDLNVTRLYGLERKVAKLVSLAELRISNGVWVIIGPVALNSSQVGATCQYSHTEYSHPGS
jgi:hypothetical protein